MNNMLPRTTSIIVSVVVFKARLASSYKGLVKRVSLFPRDSGSTNPETRSKKHVVVGTYVFRAASCDAWRNPLQGNGVMEAGIPLFTYDSVCFRASASGQTQH